MTETEYVQRLANWMVTLTGCDSAELLPIKWTGRFEFHLRYRCLSLCIVFAVASFLVYFKLTLIEEYWDRLVQPLIGQNVKKLYKNTGWSKSLCTPDDYNTERYLAQSDCLAADCQGQVDTRLTLTSSVIHNSNYFIMVSDWKCLKYTVCFVL
jgi:hypothetical protein